MFKKLFAVTVVLFLAALSACSARMSGETTTVCQDAPATVMTIASNIEVTIEGMDEDIVTWTERITVTPSEYSYYFWGFNLEDEEIHEAFEMFAEPIGGLSWNLVSLDGDTLVFEVTYHYEDISINELNEIWDTDDFESEVTLSGAIIGLEDQGATCETN